MNGAYGVMVSTTACGAVSSGSNPDRHPIKKKAPETNAGAFFETNRRLLSGVM